MADESGAAASGDGLPDLTGSRVGRFQVLERLGVGGMGEVYLAEDSVLERRVALKRLAPKVRADARFRRRLITEARRASALSSPRIAALHDVLEEGGEVFLVMEHVEGEPLRRRVGEPLPVPEVVSIARQCAEALMAAHGRGILHRDIKPDNLMVTPSGDLKVLDFGVARRLPSRDELATADETLTATEGGLTGTPSYMAPEELLQREADGRADLFSLGVVLYEALTGEHPFRDETFVRTADRILHQEPPPPSRANPEVPPALDAVVGRLLAKEPEARYAEARLLLDDLEELEADRLKWSPARAGAGRLPALLHSPTSRWLAAAAMLVLVAALLAGLLGTPGRVADEPRLAVVPAIAVLPFENLTGDPANEHLGLGIADSLTTRLAGVPSAVVIPWSEIRGAMEAERDPRRTARDLGATFLVDGGVQKAAEQLLVNVRVVGRDGAVVWADEFEGEAARPFGLHRRLAEEVSSSLHLRLTAEDRERLAAHPTENVEAYERYIEALALFETPDLPGHTQRAIELLRRTIEADPSFGSAYALLGDAYWSEYRETRDTAWAERALEATRRASELDPDNPLVRLSVARSYRQTGRLDEAEAEVSQALILQPANDEAYAELARVLEARNRPEEAVDALRRAVKLNPDSWLNHNRLGVFHWHHGRFAEAVEAYRRVTELRPDSAVGFANLGAIYHVGLSDARRAIENYERALELEPDYHATHSNLGALHYDQGDYEAAAEAFERAVALAPRSPMYQKNLGDAHERLGQADRAREAYERAAALLEDQLEVNPADADALSMLAYLEAKLGRHEPALRRADEAVRLAPASYDVLYRRAVALALAGRRADALAGLEEALREGYPRRRARDDFDWGELRESPEFRTLVGAEQ